MWEREGVQGRTVLVTGATGFVGRHLVRQLVEAGADVRALVRPTSQVAPILGPGVDICEVDVTDPISLRRAVKGVDVVYHLAGLMYDWGRWEPFHRVNVQGTRHVCEAAARAGVRRLVFTSSIAATGLEDCPLLKDESHPYTTSRHPYSRSKVLAEKTVHEFSDCMETVILRPVYVYGPAEFNTGVYTIARLLRRGFRILPGNGQNWHHRIYVEDLAEALVQVGAHDRAAGKTYLVGGPLTTAAEFWQALAKAMGTRPIVFVPKAVGWALACVLEAGYRAIGRQRAPLLSFFRLGVMTNSNGCDISRIERDIGFRPTTPPEAGLRDAVDWWRAKGYL